MEDLTLTLGYLEWAIIVAVSIGLFNYFSEKYKKLFQLGSLVFLSSWIIATIVRGLKYMILDSNYELLSIRGFLMIMSEVLILVILFSGLTITFKYLKFRKTNK
jgi:hypothetical protein